MKRTAFVLFALLSATYAVADNSASGNTQPTMTLAAADIGYQARRVNAPAAPAARVEAPSIDLSSKTLELNQSINAQLEQRLTEKFSVEFDLDF